MNNTVPLFKISTSKKDEIAACKIIKSGQSWAVGQSISIFEKKICSINKTKFAVSFNSGTSALIAMILSSGLKNAEIIVPSFSFIATASSVILSGNKVKFCDIEKTTYGLCYKSLKKIITKKTKAVILMHYSGSPAYDSIKISKLCKKNNIILFEDNAHSYGACLDNINTGTFGLASALSFCQNKLITTGEGGAVVTNDKVIYEKLKLIRSHGRVENSNEDYFNSNKEFDYIDVGYNFRMSSINAAIGISQIDNNFKKNIRRRISIGKLLNKELNKCKFIVVPKILKNADHFFQQYTIRIKENSFITRDELKNYLIEKGISCRVYYEPIHLKTYYKNKYKKRNLCNTENISKSILTLPIYPEMTKKEIFYITKNILNFFGD